MHTHTFIAEGAQSTVLVGPATTAAANEAYVAPAAGSMGLNLRAVVKMGEATDLVLTLKSADDTTGTNATDILFDVPVYVDGVRDSDAKTYTVTEDAGNFIIDFVVDPGLIPEDKTIGIHSAIANAATLICTTAIENSTTKPSV
jgi:hypothetical protein